MKKLNFKEKTLPIVLAGAIMTSFSGCSETKNSSSQIEYDYPKTTLATADDAVIYDYVSELANDSFDACNNSQYKDYVYPEYQERCQRPYIKMMGSYDEYLICSGIKNSTDEQEQELLEMFPISSESIDKKHQSFVNYAIEAEGYAQNYSPQNTFENTIYAYAIVKEDDLLEYPDATQRPYYVPLEVALNMGLISNEYNMNNLPDNSEIINGKLYVSAFTVSKTTEEGLILSKSK